MAEVDPDQEAALRRLRAAFGFVEVLRIIDHNDRQDQDDDQLTEEGDQAPTGRPVALVRRRHVAAVHVAAVHDSLALVWIRPQQLIGRRPARMFARGVAPPGPTGRGTSGRSPRSGSPTAPRLARVVETEQGVGLGEADLQAGDADQHREQALDLAEGPGEGPAEGTVRPHSAPPMLELVFERR
jgi:hypothetical protein